MRLRLFVIGLFNFLFTFLFTSLSFGAQYEYYVYGGFDAAVNAWHKVSLIFGGRDYLSVLFLAAVASSLILFYAILIRAALGARADLLRGFGVPFLGGLVLGALFIIPKDSLVIYDPVSARGPQRIDGIPRIIALAAFVSNKVERLMIDVIDRVTISESGKYSRNAGGVSYAVLRELYTKAQLDDCSVTTLSNYIHDCVLLQVEDLNRRGLIQKVKSGEIDFFDLLSNAIHPSLNTSVCNPATKASEMKTCEAAFNQNVAVIRDRYHALVSSNGDFIRSACVQLGFSDNPIGLNQCHSLIVSTFNEIASSAGFINSNIGLMNAKRQYDMARIWRLVLLSNDPALATATIATSQTMSSFWGLGVHANSWLPVIKASVTSLAIALTPVVLILLVTPLAVRALSFVFGVFIWITCWTLVDALVLSLGHDLARYYASGLKSGTQTVGFGTTVSLVFPDFLEKVIATFGMLRWAGLGLATVLSTMLVRFGGTVMAMVASQITSAPMGAGASVGSQVAISPSSLLTGTVLPMETYGAVAVRAGGLGAIYNPLMRMEMFGLSGKVHAGDHGISGDAYIAGKYAGNVQAFNMLEKQSLGRNLGPIERIEHTAKVSGEIKAGSMLGNVRYFENLSKLTDTSAFDLAYMKSLYGKVQTLTSSQAENLIKAINPKQELSPELAKFLREAKHVIVENITFDPSGNLTYATLRGATGGATFTVTPAGMELKERVHEKVVEIGGVKYLVKGEVMKLYNIDGQHVGYVISGIFTDQTSGNSFVGKVSIDPQSGKVIDSDLRSILSEGQSAENMKLGHYTLISGVKDVKKTPSGLELVSVTGIIKDDVTGKTFYGTLQAFREPGKEPSVVLANLNEGSNIKSTQNYVIELSTSDPKEIEWIAKLFEAAGNKVAAQRIRRMKSLNMRAQLDPRTGVASYIQVFSGSEVYDTSLTKVQRGYIEEWLNFIHSKRGQLEQHYYGRGEHYLGTDYGTGNDLLSMILNLDYIRFYNRYGLMWRNPEAQAAILKSINENLKTFGSIDKDAITEFSGKISGGWKRFGLDLNELKRLIRTGSTTAGAFLLGAPHPLMKGAGAGLLLLGALLVDLEVTAQSRGTTRISANDVMASLNKLVDALNKRNDLSDIEKSRILLEATNELYRFFMEHAEHGNFRRAMSNPFGEPNPVHKGTPRDTGEMPTNMPKNLHQLFNAYGR
ncbi:MAG: conjugal transfer protein TraG N-terminal domain-containing protein [Desulfurococcaceae archaeon]